MKFKFAHLADCHLGSWRQDELQKLNFESFQKAMDLCISEKVDFILISGDLFDSAYPPIEILKETFSEFRRIHDCKIPVFIVAGSHDFSSSGKTFLDVLEKAGFCKNVENFELTPEKLLLRPYLFNDIALFGYSGKKSSMEIEDLKKVSFDSVYPFSIFMLHTTIKDVVGNIPMESIDKEKLPLADYYAMGHIHQVYESQEKGRCFVYPGPIFPNNFQELADLECGSFELVEVDGGKIKLRNIKLKLKEIVYLEIKLEDGLTATEKIIYELDKNNLKDRIVLMKLKGKLTLGKTGDIRFDEIEEFVKKKEAFSFLRNTSGLETKETELEITETKVDNIEEKIIEEYSSKNPDELNKILPRLIEVLSVEKNEDEKSVIFENRLIGELNKLLGAKL
jgi:DNA repair exonuclease SbcCD nuclease subunit